MARSGVFEDQGRALGDYLSQLFVRSIRAGLLRGLDAAVAATRQDSSQAAMHWMIAGIDASTSRPWSRRFGKLQYVKGQAPVGIRGSMGAAAEAVQAFVHQRELNDVLNKLVAGRKPEFNLFLYNAVGEVNRYSENAAIDKAGFAGAVEVVRYAEAQFAAANTRKVKLT